MATYKVAIFGHNYNESSQPFSLSRKSFFVVPSTAIQEILSECAAIGAPEPEYLERGSTFVVIFYKNQRKLKEHHEITPRQQQILAILAKSEICSINHILQTLDNLPTDRTLRSDLAQLEKLHRIERVGQGRATMWHLVK